MRNQTSRREFIRRTVAAGAAAGALQFAVPHVLADSDQDKKKLRVAVVGVGGMGGYGLGCSLGENPVAFVDIDEHTMAGA